MCLSAKRAAGRPQDRNRTVSGVCRLTIPHPNAETDCAVHYIPFDSRHYLCGIELWYRCLMKGRHAKTLDAVFADPVRANVFWSDVETLFSNLGADLSEGRGSCIRVSLNGVDAVFHRPHPQKETDKGAFKSVRRFLTEAGYAPDAKR